MHLTIAQTFKESDINGYLETLTDLKSIVNEAHMALIQRMIMLVLFTKTVVKKHGHVDALFYIYIEADFIDVITRQASPVISPVFTLN